MQKEQGNTFKCDEGEIVTLTFEPSDAGILRVKSRENAGDDFIDVGDNFKLERKIGSEQVNVMVEYQFFPGASGNCQIFLEGSGGGGKFENKPPAKDRPGLPENRTYRFKPQ